MLEQCATHNTTLSNKASILAHMEVRASAAVSKYDGKALLEMKDDVGCAYVTVACPPVYGSVTLSIDDPEIFIELGGWVGGGVLYRFQCKTCMMHERGGRASNKSPIYTKSLQKVKSSSPRMRHARFALKSIQYPHRFL